MRYRTVFFDLDGTLIDSAAMILASFRHATRTVLRREIPDQELLAAVGGPGLRAQMEALAPDRVDELVEVYSEHNVGLHPGLQACDGVLDLLAALKDEGRRLGVVTAKRRATLALAFEVLPELEPFFDVTIAAEDTERHKPHPQPLLTALERLDEEPGPRRLRRRLAVRRPGREGRGHGRDRRHVGRDPPARAARAGAAGRDRRGHVPRSSSVARL